MKRTLLVGGLAALTLAAAVGVAVARQTPDRPARALRADTDGDGRLNRAEFVGQRVQRLTAADTDRDGSVSTEEMRAAAQGRMTRHAAKMEARGPVVIADAQAKAEQAFTRLDADQDGYLSADERRAGMQAMRERRDRRAAPRGQQQASPQAPASE